MFKFREEGLDLMLDIGHVEPLFGVKKRIDRPHGNGGGFGQIGDFHLFVADLFKESGSLFQEQLFFQVMHFFFDIHGEGRFLRCKSMAEV